MTGFLKGSATAMITPFNETGVDLEAFGKMMEYQIAGGTDALVVLGTTGEPSVMTDEDKQTLMRYAVEKAAGRIKIIFGTGSNCTAHAVKASVLAEKLGADGVLAVTPYYNKCTQQGLYEYYEAIAGAIKIPVICYNVPARTGVNILPETMARIAQIPNIAGIKEASGNMAQVLETARLIRGKCDLYSGEDALNLPILCAGGTAVISVISNLAPKQVKAMTTAVAAGNLDEAIALHDKLLPLTKACFTEVNPIPVKEGMNLLGFRAGAPVAPLTRLEPAHREQLASALKELGLI
ncbi:MAG: 4-hydroxy-tetrahydrodipicolinate synthase [Clostridia bacterium]|nr:4-hydroxy-tetrahydrodipicolinate synthase [Clostridia bacterium]